MRGRSKALATVIAALLAVGLAACGGGDSDETTTSTTNAATAPATSGDSAQRPPSAGGESSGGSGGEEQEPARGGEASIEDFGAEAAGAERAAILGSFEGYLNAIAGEEHAAACSHLAANVQRSLELLAPKRLKGKGCAAILPRLLAPTAAAIAREQAAGRITKVRVEGDRAFVVFHAPGAVLYQMTMAREGGGWKATTVAASVLVPEL